MSQFTVKAPCGTENDFDTKAEAEDGIDTHEALCEECSPGDCEIETTDAATPKSDGGEVDAEVVDHTEPEPSENFEDELPENPPVDTDPLDWIPAEFQDTIDGSIAINRKGFEVLAHHYNISCETDMVEFSDETVIHKATAKTEDGTVYTAYGEAHSSEDKPEQLVRLSDTRAFKRSVSRATGIGMVAVSELKNEL